MARDSMMEDMANNIMVLSKINTSTSDLSPITAPNMSKRRRQPSYYDASISAELSNQNLNYGFQTVPNLRRYILIKIEMIFKKTEVFIT